MTRRGVALLTVLWVLAALGTAVTLGLTAARDGAATSRARSARIRARWAGDGCLSLLRAALERALRDARDDVWRSPQRLTPPACLIDVATPEDGPLDLNSAAPAQLATLPGFGPAVVAIVLERRGWRDPLRSLDDLLVLLPRDERHQVEAAYASLVSRVVFEPSAWVMTAGAWDDGRRVLAVRERWARSGSRIAILRRELL